MTAEWFYTQIEESNIVKSIRCPRFSGNFLTSTIQVLSCFQLRCRRIGGRKNVDFVFLRRRFFFSENSFYISRFIPTFKSIQFELFHGLESSFLPQEFGTQRRENTRNLFLIQRRTEKVYKSNAIFFFSIQKNCVTCCRKILKMSINLFLKLFIIFTEHL